MHESSECLHTVLATRALLGASPLFGGPEAHGALQIGVLFSEICHGRPKRKRGSCCVAKERNTDHMNPLGGIYRWEDKLRLVLPSHRKGNFLKGIFS